MEAVHGELEQKGSGRKHEKTKHTVGMKGNEKWDNDEISRMTHNNFSSPTNSQSDIERGTQRGAAR